MARPRTLRSPASTDGIAGATIDHDALAAAGEASAERARALATVDADFGVDMPYQVELYIATIRQYAAESATRLIQIGCMLVQLHERESREDFRAILERCGVSERFAHRARQAAIKLRDRKAIQSLGVSKALELLSEDDDTLDALEEGGTLAGHTLDDIDCMTVRELKAALRDERRSRADEKAADEEIIRHKDERINKLMRAKRKLASSSVREQVDELLRDMDEAAMELAKQAGLVLDGFRVIEQLYADAGEQVEADVAARLEQNTTLASDWLRELSEANGD